MWYAPLGGSVCTAVVTAAQSGEQAAHSLRCHLRFLQVLLWLKQILKEADRVRSGGTLSHLLRAHHDDINCVRNN
jgi:hypothetical protein